MFDISYLIQISKTRHFQVWELFLIETQLKITYTGSFSFFIANQMYLRVKDKYTELITAHWWMLDFRFVCSEPIRHLNGLHGKVKFTNEHKYSGFFYD